MIKMRIIRKMKLIYQGLLGKFRAKNSKSYEIR